VLVLALVSWQSLARDFYVSPKGKDTNPGIQSQPFATLEKATTSSLPREPVSVSTMVPGAGTLLNIAISGKPCGKPASTGPSMPGAGSANGHAG
jgi:hypothetical protein